jgi:sirohydrochlorin cobaltochelatase
MTLNALADDALLLIGHGSSRYQDAGRPLHAHAATLRAQGRFKEVAVGLLAGAPSPAAALAGLGSRTVHIVPCFMEDGYFTRVAVPRALGLEQPDAGRNLRYLSPIGAHETMPAIIQRHVLQRCAEAGVAPAHVALVLVGHGSSRAPGRLTALHRHTAALQDQRVFGDVQAAFLEEAPLVGDTLALLRDRTVCVLGFFAGAGGHVRDDLPGLIQTELDARTVAGRGILPLHDFGTVGDLPDLPALIMDIVMSPGVTPPRT